MNMPNANFQPPPSKPAPKTVEQVGLRVSLIPEEEEKIKDPRAGFRKFILISILGILLIGAVSGILQYRVAAAGREMAAIDAEAMTLEQQSRTVAPSLKEAKQAQVRLAAIASLLASHRNGSQIFAFFEKHTLGDVAYSSITIGENSVVNLATSAGSFESYAAEINELSAQPQVKSVMSSGLNPIYDEKNKLKQVDFALSVTFDPAIFINSMPTE